MLLANAADQEVGGGIQPRTMRRSIKPALLVFVLFTSVLLPAKKPTTVPHAPLSATVMNAKTIYIQNDSGHADIADKAYAELKEWGKYRIVDSSTKADLVLILTVSSGHTATSDSSSVDLYNSQTGAWTSGTVETPSTRTWNFTNAKLIDPTTGDTEWTDRKRWERKQSATMELIRTLQHRIEEQEKMQAKQ
jgi:hypothetical protein